MKSTTLILFALIVGPSAILAQLGKGGYNQAALAGANRSPVAAARAAVKGPPPAPVQQVQQKFEEEEDESALLAAQRQRPRPQPPPPAPQPLAPPPAPRPQPPRPVFKPQPAPQVLAPVRPRPPAPAPVSEEGPHPAPEPYSFSYAVNDEQSGAQLQREESQDANGNIVGFYTIADADGRLRRVEYTAGPEGFKATVKSNEEGLASRDPADAKFDIDEASAASRQASAGAKPKSAGYAAGNRY